MASLCGFVYESMCKDDGCAMFFCFQAEDGIRDLVRSRGLGDVYKRQVPGIKSISAFELPTNSFYAMQAAIEKFQTIGFMLSLIHI